MNNQFALIIFDVDGTLTTTKSNATFRKSADDWQWLPGRLEKLQELDREGIELAIATNQGGVAFGYMEKADILHELANMAEEARIPLGRIFTCFTHPKASIEAYRLDDLRRKPGPGMLLQAMDYLEASPEETLFVGDRPEDEGAAKAANCSFMWAGDFFS